MSDLDKLIEAVEAGMVPSARDAITALTIWQALGAKASDDARAAYNGSLDAALRLHEALLPGWHWKADDGQGHESPFWHVFKIDGEKRKIGEGESEAPSRAWLIAILRAVKAQEERG